MTTMAMWEIMYARERHRMASNTAKVKKDLPMSPKPTVPTSSMILTMAATDTVVKDEK